MKLLEALKGPQGGFDTARILFALGGVGIIFMPPIFQGIALYKGQAWDPVAFIGAWGVGMATYLGGGGFAISTKDKGVASALNTTSPAGGGGQP